VLVENDELVVEPGVGQFVARAKFGKEPKPAPLAATAWFGEPAPRSRFFWPLTLLRASGRQVDTAGALGRDCLPHTQREGRL